MESYKKLAIVGTRQFQNYALLKNYADKIIEMCPEISCIVSGGARGADSLAEKYAKEKGLNMIVFPAEWDKYGKSAGYRRNADIVNFCDILIAFWDEKSPGTKHSIDLAMKKGIPTYIIKYDSVINNHIE